MSLVQPRRFGNLIFQAKNWFKWKKKFVYVLNCLKTFKAVHKNNPRTHLPQQNKKAVLMTAAYFKVFTPVRSQGQVSLVAIKRTQANQSTPISP